ncbi:MAG TPA: amidohydrolase family protein [Gemmatimonadales bacterium]|nr:amidohydrolase family protein [Gemmatimonadales bacterium]
MIAVIIAALALQSPSPASSPAPAAVVIRAGTLIDGTGAAPVRNAVIVIQGDRIIAVGTGVQIPAGATVIDLSGATVLPGFIDAHVHLASHTIGDGDWQHAGLVEMPSQLALLGAAHAHQTLEAGFTTVRVVGSGNFGDVALRNAIDAGWIPGPRIVAAGISFGIRGGHCDGTNGLQPWALGREAGLEAGVADGVEEGRNAVRYAVKYGADVIKICATGGVLSLTDSVGVQQYTEEEMRAIVTAAAQLDRRVAAHAHGTAGIKAAVRAGVASIEHGSILDAEAVALMKQKGTFLVPTLLAGFTVESLATARRLPPPIAAKALAIAPRMHASFKLAVDGGVKIALGTDAGVMRHGSNAREFALMVRYGMTPMQAIVAGTSSGATLLGLEREVGTIAVGRRADIVAVVGNPLDNIEILQNVQFVMKDGKVFKRDGQVLGRSAAGVP